MGIEESFILLLSAFADEYFLLFLKKKNLKLRKTETEEYDLLYCLSIYALPQDGSPTTGGQRI